MPEREVIMGKEYPMLVVKPANMKSNMEKVVAIAAEGGMKVTGVSKGFCSIPECCRAMLEAGCENIGVARAGDLKKLKAFDPSIETLLTRIPMMSEAEEVARYADISLVSGIEVMEALNEKALACGRTLKVIIMQDIGDLREGYYDQEEMVRDAVRVEQEMPGLMLYGVGTNFGCYGSVNPSPDKMELLTQTGEMIEARIGRKLDVYSVGGTQVLNLVPEKGLTDRINNARCGIVSITKAPYTWEADIPDRLDTFRLRAEIIELRDKPTMPNGKMGSAALNEKRVYVDRGIRRRAIVALGRQDIGEGSDSILPVEPGIEVLGSSSDHTILDVEDYRGELRVGGYIEFNINYVACMHLTMSSDLNIRII